MNKIIHIKILVFFLFFILVFISHFIERNNHNLNKEGKIDHHEHSTIEFVPCAHM